MKILNATLDKFKTLRRQEPQIIEARDKIFLYDSNSMLLSEVKKDEMKGLNAQELCTEEAPYWELPETPRWKSYIVFQATYACNLACNYCFVKHHYPDHTNSLDFKTAVDALQHYQGNWRENGFHIGFFGGEPLMNWELIYTLVEWCKKQAVSVNNDCIKRCTWHITTNGTLITEEIAQYLAENNFSLIISLDGCEEDHNEARPYAGENKNNSWKDTMRGLEFVATAFKRLGKRSSVTLRSTFDKNGCDLVARLKFLNQLMYDGKAGHVSVEPSCLAESCSRESFEGLNEDEIRAKFQEQYFKAADWFLAEIRAGRKPSFHHFEVPLQRLYDREAAPSECGAGKGYISVGPGGKIAACHREHESVVGNMYDGLDKTKLAAWNDNRYFNRTGCNECWLRNFCGGGCRCNSALLYKNLTTPSKVECVFREMQTKAVMWLMSEMQEKEKRKFSKSYGQFDCVYPWKVEPAKPCSDPNNCQPCREKLQTQNKQILGQPNKQQAACGLRVCEGEHCPFTHCGKQTPEEFQAGLKKINERK